MSIFKKSFFQKYKWILVIITATVVWGFSFVAQLEGGNSMGTFWFNGIRFTLGGLVLILPMLLTEKKQFKEAPKLVGKTFYSGVLAGIFLLLGVTFQQWGINITHSPGIAAFVTDLYTILVPIVMFVLFRQKTSLKNIISVLLATLGLYFLCILGVKTSGDFYADFGTMLFGEAILFVCMLCFTAHVVFVDKAGDNLPSLAFCIVQFLTVGLLSSCIGLFFEEISMAMILEAIVPILYCALFSTGIGYTCQVIGQKHVDASICVILLSLESVFSTIFSVIMGYDKLTFAIGLGCILIFAAIVFAGLNFETKDKK